MTEDMLETLERKLDNLKDSHRYDFILDTATQILAIAPTHEQANFFLIRALYGMGRYEDMLEAINGAAANFSNRAWLHFQYYLYYLYKGGQEYLKARDHIKTAISMDPSVAYYYRCAGEIYLINREADKAVPYLAQAVELAPDNAEYRARLSLGLLRMHKVRESLEMAAAALGDGAEDARVYDDIGMIYTLAGDLEKGEELFRAALRLMPTHDYFQKHIDWVIREKEDRKNRYAQGLRYTPLYLRHKGTKRFFDEDQ